MSQSEENRPGPRINSKLSADSKLAEVAELCKRRGFVYPSSEIYGGFAASYDYGPLGALMLNNIKSIWQREIVQRDRRVVMMDGAIISHPKVWEASGHVEAFNDPLVEDLKTHTRHRADKLIEEALGLDTSSMSFEDMNKLIKENNLKSPDGNPLSELKRFNLLVEALMGSTTDSKQNVYLRGETCQTIFINFKNLMDTARVSMPFGVVQIGKAFRNEITARQFIIRTREFEQLEFEFFFDPEDGNDWYSYWNEKFLSLLEKNLGLPRSRLRMRELPKEEMSHYAKKQADFEFNLKSGDWLEISPMNHRGDWDLGRHSKFSGTNLTVFDQKSQKHVLPNVIETSFGLARLFYVLIDDALHEEKVEGSEESRSVLKLHWEVAPYKVAVFPLSKKPELQALSEKLFHDLSAHYSTAYDEAGSIGKRYRRQDEIGTPYCVTVDFDSLNDQAVTVRGRDTMTQERVPVARVGEYLAEKMKRN